MMKNRLKKLFGDLTDPVEVVSTEGEIIFANRSKCALLGTNVTHELIIEDGPGLATTYSKIKGHGGHINVRTACGEGAKFDAFLPASTAPPGKGDKKKKDDLVLGSGRVLVMDDEEIIRSVSQTILTMLGYESECTSDGDGAVDAFRKARDEGDPFDLVILDLTVPGGKGGEEAVKEILDIDPGARVIVSSGYSDGEVLSEYARHGFKGVVTKPYLPSELSKAVADALSEKGEDG